MRSLFRLLASIRLDEVCVLQGAPLIGAMFALETLTPSAVLLLVAVLSGSFALVAHVFVLNDWAGVDGDLADPARVGRTFVERGVSRGALRRFAVVLLALALLVFWFVNVSTLILALLIACASALYSVPGSHMKGLPVASSALHFVGGALHFLLGYAAFAPIDRHGAAISVFFGLVFMAGHFNHEARGYEADGRNRIRTNAVAFGQRRAFVAGMCAFTAAYALLALLAMAGIAPQLLLVAALFCPLHLWLSLRALRGGLMLESLIALQHRYRMFYAVIGVTMMLTA
jgi:4-hydroxybenzoate polyprenyltransferase